jgi:hypothetical protein
VIEVRRPVTLTDILDEDAVLDIECLDRIYLKRVRFGAADQRAAGRLLKNQRGYPVPSPAALGRIREAFIRAVDSYADANSIE